MTTRHFIVDYDFVADAPGRTEFYRQAAMLLEKPLKSVTSSNSVARVTSQELAEKIYNLAVKYGARDAILSSAVKILEHHTEANKHAGET